MVKAVDFGVVVRHAHGFRTDIHRRDAGCTALSRIEGKAACVSKAVEDMLALGNFGYGLTIIFLVQEEAGFLAIFHIHSVLDAIFHDFCSYLAMIGQKRRLKPLLTLLHALKQANLHIIALEKATDILAHLLQNLDEQIKEHFLAQLDAQRESLSY